MRLHIGDLNKFDMILIIEVLPIGGLKTLLFELWGIVFLIFRDTFLHLLSMISKTNIFSLK